MAKIDLRAYYDEIESLINRGRYDEAIAHCRHILQVFPKSVQTYRLLGKAFLEAKRYTDAVDIFQRVLSALPSDFVSHLGLSIIREDEGNLDAAIWHMERAFEIQPYNGAIQEELRRLYQRRDGSSPPKIRLTKPALARMYAKGNLFQQSAAEARTVLSADPQRLDIQILLARMYLNSGKSVEAAEISSKVLNRLPYSLEANRILVSILQNSEHREEHREYKDRLISLDPYEARVMGGMNDASQVPSEVVQIDKLDLAGDQLVTVEAPADWMTSLGLTTSDFDTELDDEIPDWLIAASEQIQQETTEDRAAVVDEDQDEDFLATDQTDIDSIEWLGQTEEPPSAADDTPSIQEQEIEQEDEFPGWMQEAGWQEQAEELDESTAPEESHSFDFEDIESETAPAAEADIPDWLRDLAPDDVQDDPGSLTTAETEESDEEDAALAALFDFEDEDAEDTPPAGADITVLDAGEQFEEQVQDELSLEEVNDLPEIPTTDEAISTEESEPETELPDWLQEFDLEAEAKEIQTTDEESPENIEIPDWLAGIEADETQDIITEEQIEEPAVEDQAEITEIEPQIESDIASDPELPDWLIEFEEQTPEVDEAVELDEPAPPAVPADELPDWLAEIEDTDVESGLSVEAEQADEEVSEISIPEGTTEEVELEEPPDFTDADDALAWLAGLAAGQEIEEESAEAEVVSSAEETQVQAPDAEQTGTVDPAEDTEMEMDEGISSPESAETKVSQEIELEAPPDFEDMDDAVSWLEQLAEQEPTTDVDLDEPDTGWSAAEPGFDDTAESSETPAAVEYEDFEAELSEAEEETFEEPEEEASAAEIEKFEKIDLNEASLVEIERQPGVGFQTAQLIVAYRESHGPFLSVDDVSQIPGIDPDDIFTLQEYFTVNVAPEEAQPPAKQEDSAVLLQARQAANQGEFETALQHYTRLVNDGHNLDDVIFDLNQQLQSRPDNIELWQLVGDAYMRNNQLIEAMQAYNKAEELLH